MNSIHNNGPDDKRLDDELEELGQVYRQLAPEDPPELLDQAILNSAHRAVGNKDHWLDFGWIHGLTTAAVIVLALSIILTQRQPIGLEENGLAPADVANLQRSREVREQRVDALEYKKMASGKLEPGKLESGQELSKDSSHEYRTNMFQLPAASAPEAQAGARTEHMAARKAIRLNGLVPEEEPMQENTTVATDVATPAVVGFADDSPLTETDKPAINAYKVDADKSAAEHLQAILVMQAEQDDSWKAALKIFIETYPDYPLPDELKN